MNFQCKLDRLLRPIGTEHSLFMQQENGTKYHMKFGSLAPSPVLKDHLTSCRSDEPNNQRDMSLQHRVTNTLEELEVIYATRTALLTRTYSHTFAHVTGNCEYFRNRN